MIAFLQHSKQGSSKSHYWFAHNLLECFALSWSSIVSLLSVYRFSFDFNAQSLFDFNAQSLMTRMLSPSWQAYFKHFFCVGWIRSDSSRRRHKYVGPLFSNVGEFVVWVQSNASSCWAWMENFPRFSHLEIQNCRMPWGRHQRGSQKSHYEGRDWPWPRTWRQGKILYYILFRSNGPRFDLIDENVLICRKRWLYTIEIIWNI